MKKRLLAATLLTISIAAACTEPAFASSPGIWLESTMNGNFYDGSGDSNGWATFSAHVNVPASQMCYTLDLGSVSNPRSAKIRQLSGGDWNWPHTVLNLSVEDGNEGCVTVDAGLLQDMVDNPANYIVQINTWDFEHGAVRGGLAVQDGDLNPLGTDDADPDAERSVTALETERILLLHARSSEGAAFAILHFADGPVTRDLPWPVGEWIRRFDASEARFAGPGASGPDAVTSEGAVRLRLPAHAALHFHEASQAIAKAKNIRDAVLREQRTTLSEGRRLAENTLSEQRRLAEHARGPRAGAGGDRQGSHCG